MAKLEFHLFRAKFIKSMQASLFYPDMSPSEIFVKALNEKPSFEMRNGHTWHIGNIEFLNDGVGYFAVGRTTKSIVEKYDEDSKNFIVEENEESPYTHALFSSSIGLIAIAKKTKLSPKVKGIARKIETLFENAKIIRDHDVEVAIDFIRDPESFVSHLQSAYAIKRYTASFGGPNPFDADEFFQKPMSVYLQKADGKRGKIIIDGDDLNLDTLEKVTVAVASTGNDASARILAKESDKVKIIYLVENQIVKTIDEEAFDKKELISDLTTVYNNLRDR